jgi:hypothetical protein
MKLTIIPVGKIVRKSKRGYLAKPPPPKPPPRVGGITGGGVKTGGG